MTQNINQFSMTSQQGQIDLPYSGAVLSCQVAASQATALVPGQAVKLADVAGGVPKVVSIASDADDVFGFVVLNLKDSEYAAGARLEIAIGMGVMYMTSGAAITRGAKIEVNDADTTVITNAGTNPVSGTAIDKATASGQLIRVMITTPFYAVAQNIASVSGLQAALDAKSQSIVNVVTTAEINAGKTLVAVATGKKAIVTGVIARAAGNFAGMTSLELNVGAGVVVSIAVADLQNGDVVFVPSTEGAAGALFGIAGADGADITVSKTGSSATVGTSVTFTVTYQLIDA